MNMKTIRYKSNNNGRCLDLCPHGVNLIINGIVDEIYVGSISCDNCKHNRGNDEIKKIVICDYKKQDEDNN